MKIINRRMANESDISYMKEDLISIAKMAQEGLEQAQFNSENNLQMARDSITLDYQSLIDRSNKEYEEQHNKKFNKITTVATIASVLTSVGILAAGALSNNPTFFSVGNIAAASLLPAFAFGVSNYFRAFTLHLENNEEAKGYRDQMESAIENVPFTEYALHDQREIEINQAFLDAASSALGIDDIPLEVLQALVERRMENEMEGDREL